MRLQFEHNIFTLIFVYLFFLVSIRGRIIKGLVISTKMKRTIIVRRDYLQYVKKYRRYEKRHKNIPAHVSPCFKLKEGDVVTIGQCR